MIEKIKDTISLKFVKEDINGDKTIRMFKNENSEKKTDFFRIEEMRKKVRKCMLNEKGYKNSFNSWINVNIVLNHVSRVIM